MSLTKKIILISLILAISFMGCSKKTAKKPVRSDIFLNSSEYKLLLNPKMFTDYEKGFQDYWEIIKTVAKQEGINIIEKDNPMKTKHKDISFYDTENLDLQKHSFLLRYKRKYKGNEYKPGAEYTLKYRNRSAEKVIDVDLKTGVGFTAKHEEIELESDIVYNSALNGKLDISYTMANGIDLEEKPISNIEELVKVYPVIKTIGLDADTKLVRVANVIADERMVMPGKLDFGDGLFGRMDMTVWIIQTEDGKISVPEFSFDHPFSQDKKYSDEAMQKCTSFIDKLKEYKPEWVVPGVLKAAVVFDLMNK